MSTNTKTTIRKQKWAKGLLLAAVFLFVGAGCTSSSGGPAPQPLTIDIWRTGEQPDELYAITEEYKAVYPHVSFEIRSFTQEEYEEALLDAWAKGEGPDIFSVPNQRLGEYVSRGLVSPMPTSVSLPRSVAQKSFGKTTVVTDYRTTNFPTENQIRDQFVQVVGEDVIFADGTVAGLPYSVDTMVMYYNRDLLARANVAVPPTTWTEFRDAVEAMVELDDEGQVVLPAAALGTSNNVPHYFDIVSLLMMQNGSTMLTNNGFNVIFAGESETRPGFLPGQEAVSFYAAFADEALRTFTWDAQQPDALEAFTAGNLGFYFGYYNDKAVIEQRAPGLNFSFVKVPQVDPSNTLNYANYNVESVHVGSDNAEHAWNFILFTTGQDRMVRLYEQLQGVPSRKALIGELQEDPEYGPVAQQALTAKSWYHGNDTDLVLEAFADMITDANEKTETIEDIVQIAAQRINLTLR